MTSTTTGLLILLASTTFLTGLIWTVQVVHYPLFSQVGETGFVAYEAAHSTRMGAVVTVPWAIHGVATAWLLTTDLPRGPVLLAAVLAATTVLVTVVWSVPAHGVLGGGFDAGTHGRLVATNWLRTVAWTGNAAVAAWLLVDHLRRITDGAAVPG